ncbi:MAG TPA: hypothetical protein PK413_13845 [Thermoanaerobaculia bacterium]|nr:hypothetical protein [Thermoanaerobaculia bacterium]
MRKHRRLLELACALGLLAPLAAGAQVSGRVVLVDAEGKPAGTVADPRHAVVSFEAAGARGVSGAGRVYEMVTRGKEFVPRVLPIPKGSTVRFPNQDPILHNVFSVSTGNPFDLGLYGKGPGKAYTFNTPGVVRVFCNVHHAMVAYVVILDTGVFVSPDAQGYFSLPRAVGAGRISVWHPQGEPISVDLKPGEVRPLELKLVVAKGRIPPHLNKAGKAYARDPRDRYNGSP